MAQIQNLILQSQTFDNASWAKANGTITTAATIAPDGTLTGEAFIANTTSSAFHYATQLEPSVSIGQPATFSFYVKAGAVSWCYTAIDNETIAVYFNISGAGSIGTITGSPTATTITALSNGWYRCSVSCIRAHIGSSGPFISPVSTGSSISYAATDTSSTQIYMWGAQYVQANWAGPYQITTGTAINNRPIRSIVYQSQNLLLQSQTFDSATWTKQYVAVTPAATIAPDGTLTGEAMVSTVTTSVIHDVNAAEPAALSVGQTTTFSVYLKAGAVSWALIYIDSGSFYVYFNMAGAGATGTATGVGTATIQAVANGWYRCSLTIVKKYVPGTVYVEIASANGSNTYAAADTTTPQIYVWGAQYVQSNQPGPYVATTTSAVNNGPIRSVVRQTRSIVPKTQNLLLQSQTFDNATWTKGNCTINTAATTAPDGTLTGEALVASTTSTVIHYVFQYLSQKQNINATFSCYIKAGTVSFAYISTEGGNVGAFFNLSGSGSVGTSTGSPVTTITALSNGWYRCSISFITSNGLGVDIYPANSGSSSANTYAATDTSSAQIYIWGAQYVQANWMGPYQVTTGTVVNNGPIRSIVPQTQNLLTKSQAIAWTVQVHITPTLNSTIAPDGTTTATLLTDSSDGSPTSHYTYISPSSASLGVLYTFSAYLKSGTLNWCNLQEANTGYGAYFNISSGVIGTISTNVNATMQSVGNGWYRCSISLNNYSGFLPTIGLASVNGSIVYAGAGTGTIYAWGAQLVQANIPGPYVATTTTTVVNNGPIRSSV
jgi:hypothetical protein